MFIINFIVGGFLLGLISVTVLIGLEIQDLELSYYSLKSYEMVINSQTYFIHLYYVVPIFFSLIGGLIAMVIKKQHKIIEQQDQIAKASKLSSIGEMAAGLAHEINNPLAVINMQSEMIRMLISKDKNVLENQEKVLKSLDLMKNTVKKITKIISGLKKFSRDGSSDPIEKTSLDEIIEGTLIMTQYKAEQNQVELINTIPRNYNIKCRNAQIEQVLVNLVGNAIDAVSKLDEKWIKISFTEDINFNYLKVTDSGKGIPNEVVEKMFSPFFTTKEVGEGTGLGLSISKGILKSHQGDLILDEKSKNTCFVLKLPKA